MKSLFSAAILACLLVPALAHAKITVFSTSDAVRKVMESDELAKLEQNGGELRKVEVTERHDSSALQAFELKVALTTATPIGPRSCFTTMEIMVVRDESAPRGITASKMLAPVVAQTICQK